MSVVLLSFASEFGPAHWTNRQWAGIALYAVLFLFLLWVIYRVAAPVPPTEESSEPGESTNDEEVT